MKHVVITGSTRGIGYGLADAFLAQGCAVVINGRSPQSVAQASQQLAEQHGRERLHGFAADVAVLAEVEALWDAAQTRFGAVDIWINNAGLGHDMLSLWDIPPERVETIVRANILGTAFGSRVAVRRMLQQGHGQLYNMEGFGSNGSTRWGLSIYGTSKAAVHYLTEALIDETKETAVQVGSLRPGMVATDLLLDPVINDPAALARSRRVFNILADRVEAVTPWLVEKMLANEKHGAHIQWLTTPRLIWRFLSAPFSKRELIDERGNLVP